MDLLDRLLGHDRWTTQQLLERCRELRAEQWAQPFDLGHQTLEATFRHMIDNVRVWTDLMAERQVRQSSDQAMTTLEDLIAEWQAAYEDFATLARRIAAEGRWDATYTDVLDDPPQHKTFGGTIAHIITHNMHHRCEVIHILTRLGLANMLEGDVLSWEQQLYNRREPGDGGIMSADRQSQFPGWEGIYQHQAIETMPWFYPELDDDLKQALSQLGVRSGSALDLGTGPGTQAMQLARCGFSVTATDISEAAIRLAREKAQAQGLAIIWQQDDILSTRLAGPFDIIFDRGCFHVLPPERRQGYVSTVASLLKPGGYLFLKCFSQLQPGTQGPHRFSPEQIRDIFGSRLRVRSITETVYQGTLDPLPRALFCLMQREE